ncbi:MAG: hypothetical protein HY910_18445 [Desulfarculus sp.]|nr:hypothetical protein [Desulfarculus sp.]
MRAKMILALLALLLAANGCAGASKTITTSLDKEGRPVKVEEEISDERAWVQGQVALAATAKPFFELKVPPGRDLVLPGGSELRLWGQPAGLKLEPYQPAWERVANRWGGAILAAGSAAFMVREMREMGTALGSAPRNNFNNVGNGVGSPFSWESQKGQGASVGVNMPTTTTTISSDDHRVSGGQ